MIQQFERAELLDPHHIDAVDVSCGEVRVAIGAIHGDETGAVDADRLRSLDLEHVPASALESASQHPLGTCRMGVSPHGSVVDAFGQAWDLPELYVADGSILPTSLGVNPQLSIMSMALRIAWHLREKRLPVS